MLYLGLQLTPAVPQSTGKGDLLIAQSLHGVGIYCTPKVSPELEFIVRPKSPHSLNLLYAQSLPRIGKNSIPKVSLLFEFIARLKSP